MSKDKTVQIDWTDNAEHKWKLKSVEGIFEVAEGVKNGFDGLLFNGIWKLLDN